LKWSLVLIVALGSAASAAPPPNPHRPPKAVDVVLLPNPACQLKMAGPPGRLKKDGDGEDYLVLRFANGCGSDKWVNFCATAEPNATIPTPWAKCVGLPTDPTLGTPFLLEKSGGAKSNLYAVCQVAYASLPANPPPPPRTFKLCAIRGDTKSSVAKCPPDGGCPRGRVDRVELALEVEP